MDSRADKAGEQFMKHLQQLGFISICAYTDPEDELGDCATEIVADPEDAETVELMIAMLLTDYAQICEWDKEEMMGFLMCLMADAMAERFGDDFDEDDEPRMPGRGGPNLRVLPGRKKDGGGQDTDK